MEKVLCTYFSEKIIVQQLRQLRDFYRNFSDFEAVGCRRESGTDELGLIRNFLHK